MDRQSELINALKLIKQRINGKNVNIVAVSKRKPASDIKYLYDYGHRHFGENYVQEMMDKARELPKDIKWHFIGTLQSNKCQLLSNMENLYAIETVGSIKTANLLNKYRENKPKLKIYLQVNTSGEDSKSGMQPDEVPAVSQYILSNCPNLKLEGLMTIGSIDNSASGADFVKLAAIRDGISSELGLSMGMSGDFEEAIKHGSTSVRIGSVIFGNRDASK